MLQLHLLQVPVPSECTDVWWAGKQPSDWFTIQIHAHLPRLPHLMNPCTAAAAGTSLENNNVFTVQPNVYFEGMDPSTESASMYADESTMKEAPLNPATVTVGIVALGIVAVAGSATAIYYEVGLWVLLDCQLSWRASQSRLSE